MKKPSVFTDLFYSGFLALSIIAGSALPSCGKGEIKERQNVSEGLIYFSYQMPVSLNRVHVIETDLRLADISVKVIKAGNRLRQVRPLSDIVKQLPDSLETLAALNGDFFSLEGIPSGALIQNGQIIKDAAESWYAFGLTDRRIPFIGQVRFEGMFAAGKDSLPIRGFNRPRLSGETVMYNSFFGPRTGTNVYGDELMLSVKRWSVGEYMDATVAGIDSVSGNNSISDTTMVISTHGKGMRAIIRKLNAGHRVRVKVQSVPDYGIITELTGGYPLLVSEGKNVIRQVPAPAFGFIRDRYARSAVGLSCLKERMYWVCAEGDQANVNRGMNLEELADFMIRLGCESALNLDGGGSSEMISGKRIINRPSEGGVERSISNAIVVTRLKK